MTTVSSTGARVSLAKRLLDTVELRAGSVITEQEINALRRRWSPNSRAVRNGRVNVEAEYERLCEALPMQISEAHAKKGWAYLRQLLLRKDGTLRQTKFVQEEGINDLHVHVISRPDHFLLSGFHEDVNNFGSVRMFPAYIAVARDGTWFVYVARPWQCGLPAFVW